jgi:hypothetical protein
VTGRGDAAWLADLAGTLAQARGSNAPGFEAGNLIDAAGFTALWLRGKGAPQARRS